MSEPYLLGILRVEFHRGPFRVLPTAVTIRVTCPFDMEKVCTAVTLCPLRKLDRSFDSVVDLPKSRPTPCHQARRR